jgi:hypothetical protein
VLSAALAVTINRVDQKKDTPHCSIVPLSHSDKLCLHAIVNLSKYRSSTESMHAQYVPENKWGTLNFQKHLSFS